MKKYIIGLGCSWTQGEGGYPEHIWKEYNGKVQLRGVPDVHLRPYEHENSWVNVLARDHFPDHTPINLGIRGIGNRAAVKQLYFSDIDLNDCEGYVVLLLSGFERFDFFQQGPCGKRDAYDTFGYVHYKWRTMWPFDSENEHDKKLWSVYQKELWSDQFVASETLMALLELQAWCKAYNFKMIVANAFNTVGGQFPKHNLREYVAQNTGTLSSKFDWTTYLHETTDYGCMIEKLILLDGQLNETNWGSYWDYYPKLKWPLKYLTTCIHPNVDGYKFIADEMSKFINHRYE